MDELKYKQSRLLKKFLDKLTDELKKSDDKMVKAIGMTMLSMKSDFVKQMEKSERMRGDFDQFIENIKIEIGAYQQEKG